MFECEVMNDCSLFNQPINVALIYLSVVGQLIN